ncbi:MAG TPA: HemK/PrmC family methyltransferase, partial [Microbacteriaceae bacterium]|nr:HemK/PrmC family methyltransferase [Microbacteriaceae bacterium]
MNVSEPVASGPNAAGRPPGASGDLPAAGRDAAGAWPTWAAALAGATGGLRAAGIASARTDAVLLAGHLLGASRGRVEAMAIAGAALSEREAARYAAMVERRAGHEPLQHIVGTAAFRTLVLDVGPGVFVPRPETEMVAQLAIDLLRAAGPGALGVDLGTGTGAIALSLAVEVPDARVVAVEASGAACSFARRNIARIAPGVRLVYGDLRAALPGVDGAADVVVSNPPYVPARERPPEPEARRDPPRALYGGPDGLAVIRVLARRAAVLVRPGGA